MTLTYQASLAQTRLTAISRQLEHKADSQVRHKCFLSYHAVDAEEVLSFVESFGDYFIPRAIGVSEDDPVIESEDSDYIMDRIRSKYLANSTVTIVMVGKCTWARKFVDWEIYSSLRRGKVNRLNGLMAIQLPSAKSPGAKLPPRVQDNVIREGTKDIGYARYYAYPTGGGTLQNWIQDAFDARTTRDHLIYNSRARKKINSSCP
ncbi:TIR domain-containing protein [Streptomyces phaeoluteigriseus]|uniref:TIR domain-containing protein n=1 Tax=Streptomyces phaeoluteigriseus TaxID=114686 RepID=UPI0009A194AE|nr:TIR domain-containing protein [Streptomyces phaeoluteigriseus]